MEEFIVISWWNSSERFNIMPEVTTHRSPKIAWREAKTRKKVLGKNSKVILAKVIKEI